MDRLTLALAALVCVGSAATGSYAPNKERDPFVRKALELPVNWSVSRVAGPESAPGLTSEFVVTKETEVLLNGERCTYSAVPGNARIVRMEVAADRKSVLRIHFRTGQ